MREKAMETIQRELQYGSEPVRRGTGRDKDTCGGPKTLWMAVGPSFPILFCSSGLQQVELKLGTIAVGTDRPYCWKFPYKIWQCQHSWRTWGLSSLDLPPFLFLVVSPFPLHPVSCLSAQGYRTGRAREEPDFWCTWKHSLGVGERWKF